MTKKGLKGLHKDFHCTCCRPPRQVYFRTEHYGLQYYHEDNHSKARGIQS